MKNYLTRVAIMLAFLSPGGIALATQDVSLDSTGNAIINVGGINLTLSGVANPDSITVGDNSFDATLTGNSTLTFVSTDKRLFTFSQSSGSNQLTTSLVCNSGNSTYTISNPSGATLTITSTPSTNTCTTGGGTSGGSGGSSGSGGGGGSSAPASTNSQASNAALATASSPSVTIVTPSSVSASSMTTAIFKTSIIFGKSNPDIKKIQELLNSDPDTMIAKSGIGSTGHETQFFGLGTKKAIKKFQLKYGIAKAGDAGYGLIGPKTRAKLNELASGKISLPAANTTPPSSTPSSSKLDKINSLLEQIKQLQTLLNAVKK